MSIMMSRISTPAMVASTITHQGTDPDCSNSAGDTDVEITDFLIWNVKYLYQLYIILIS